MKIIEKTRNLKRKKKNGLRLHHKLNNYFPQGGKIFFEIET